MSLHPVPGAFRHREPPLPRRRRDAQTWPPAAVRSSPDAVRPRPSGHAATLDARGLTSRPSSPGPLRRWSTPLPPGHLLYVGAVERCARLAGATGSWIRQRPGNPALESYLTTRRAHHHGRERALPEAIHPERSPTDAFPTRPPLPGHRPCAAPTIRPRGVTRGIRTATGNRSCPGWNVPVVKRAPCAGGCGRVRPVSHYPFEKR